MMFHKILSVLCALALILCTVPAGTLAESNASDQAAIEAALNLANNAEQGWTYSADPDAWVLSVVAAVTNPELPDYQGVSVCVPGAYVTGIDTDSDGMADVTSADASGEVKGRLVIDYTAQIVSTNGQTYSAATAPVIFTTGAAGYSAQQNSQAGTTYAAEGYVYMVCGNRGKQSSVTNSDGTVTYTGDAPDCLVDQKNAARYVKYNILLGNLPGDPDLLVSTGGSGGGAHAVMFAATSNNPDYYPYEAQAGAVGVYALADGSYSTAVNVNGEAVALSDGAWGCIGYSPITSLYEADMAQAFEYTMDTTYDFNTPFQKQLASYLSQAYMNEINARNLTADEKSVGFDLNGDGDQEDTVALTIEYDQAAHPETNGYYGTYLTLYLAEFTENLQWYLDQLDYAEDWTWFDKDGAALSDDAVAAMTAADKAQAFIEGRYAKGGADGKQGGMGMMGGTPPEGATGAAPGQGTLPDEATAQGNDSVTAMFGAGVRNGGPDAGTTASSGSAADSSTYASYDEMVAAYAADIAEIQAGDAYGNNIVSLYDPLRYIGAEGTENPVWVRMVMGAVEGDNSMMCSLNLQVAMLNAGVDAELEWQWDGGHVPSEVLGNSFSLYVDEMYGEYAGGTAVEKAAAQAVTTNGTADEATGNDLSAWVDATDISSVSFTLQDVLAYRNTGASKAVPGFDVIDYGQEDEEFGSAQADSRHWDAVLLGILQDETDAAVLKDLFVGSGS